MASDDDDWEDSPDEQIQMLMDLAWGHLKARQRLAIAYGVAQKEVCFVSEHPRRRLRLTPKGLRRLAHLARVLPYKVHVCSCPDHRGSLPDLPDDVQVVWEIDRDNLLAMLGEAAE